MGNTLYLECNSGVSGDMMVASLLDLGADEKILLEAVNSLPLHGFRVEISRVMKSGIDACDFNVILDKEYDNYDHDMEYLHGNLDEQQDEQQTEQQTEHSNKKHHDDSHNHKHNREHNHAYMPIHTHEHVHSHEHRGMNEIREIIEKGNMTEAARNLALRIFEILAKAESKAHNQPVEEVHFHEVGAVDSIVDIVAVAVCLDNLQISEVIVPKLNEGRGMVRCQHGMLPVPVPAVANIIQEHNLNIHIMEIEGEFVTPTGAAVVAAIKTLDILPKKFQVQRIGIGAGKREYERPSILRAMLIQKTCDVCTK